MLAQTLRAGWPGKQGPDRRDSAYDAQTKTEGHTHGRAQGVPENSPYSRSEPEPSPASSGWHSDATPGRLFHTPPPPRVVGGAQGASTPVSTATLGLIHRHDPSLAAQLRENPGSLAIRSTRL